MTPRKRSFPLQSGINAEKRKRNVADEYLSTYDHSNPILLSISPLKKHQRNIFHRNLTKAGACVLEDNELDSNHQHINEIKNLFVVTDDIKRSQNTINNLSLPTTSVFISTEWVTDVSSRQQNLPVDRYRLQSSIQNISKKQIPSDQTSATESPIKTPESKQKILPVWCSLPSDDIQYKHRFLQALPTFMCERSTITQRLYPAPNSQLAQIFDQIAEKRLLENAGGSFQNADIRARAYRMAGAALKCVPFKITGIVDVQPLNTIGPNVLSIIQEYLNTGQSKEVLFLETQPRLQALRQLNTLYGVGVKTARKFYDVLNITSITDLQTKIQQQPQKFSHPLTRYMKYYHDFGRVDVHVAYTLKKRVQEIANDEESENLHLRFILCGGLRRGEESGHDIDLLYCRRQERANDCNSVLEPLMQRLQAQGIVLEILKINSDTHGWGEIKYHGEAKGCDYKYSHDVVHAIAKFKNQTFRLDIVGIRDVQEFCFATIAWSGSTAFQRDIRLMCERKHNWTFNQHGLFDRQTGKRIQLNPKPMTEMDVFNAMGIPYRPPFERSC